jgi:PEP-CTERM motif
MHRPGVPRFVFALALAGAALAPNAHAVTQAVSLNVLNAAVTLPTPLVDGDNLRLNTFVTSGPGALLQSITFTVGPAVDSFIGRAAWEISSASGSGPRLIGVNIDIFDASNALVASDSFAGVLAGFALSTFDSAIGPGTYRMVATGTAVRDASLDLTLSFIGAPIPEPHALALLFAGLGVIGFVARRRTAAAMPTA